MKKVFALFTAGIASTASLLLPLLAHAQTFVPLAPAPASSKLGTLYGSGGLVGFLNNLFIAAISIGAILAVLRLGYAGYLYMTSEAWGVKSHAKEVIGDVVLGLLLLLSVYLVLKQIDPNILNLDVVRDINPVQTAPLQGSQQ